MSANSSLSSSSNFSLHPAPPNSSLNSSLPKYKCFDFTFGSHVFTALSCSYILFFFPLCIFILHMGHQRWRKRRSASAVTISNSDFFTYNIAVMEMITVLGCFMYCCGIYTNATKMKTVGIYLFTVTTPGQMFFHILTCVERYLAVIFPIFYLYLKADGVRIRNISAGCVWLMTFGWVGLTALYSPDFPAVPFVILLVFSVIVTSFCSLSVLCTLIRPGPGEGGGDGDKVDQLKRRAFHTIMAITGGLLLKFVGQLLCFAVEASATVRPTDRCLVLVSVLWFTVPGSYVLPLLFLHRAGKLLCFRSKTEPGRGSE